MTKEEALYKIYGNSPIFSFDFALPQGLLDEVVDYLVKEDFHYKNSERNFIYDQILSGCVYAYGRSGGESGLLPLTFKAKMLLQVYETENNCRLIFQPTI